jgi:DNA (cytosine-5)-methyltransferase 1
LKKLKRYLPAKVFTAPFIGGLLSNHYTAEFEIDMKTEFTVGSLFSGIGLLDLGLEQAGMKTVWQVEYDDWARQKLTENFPHTEKFKDVREVGKHNLKTVDIICGGFPCQKISKLNPNKYSLDESLELWFEQFRIISELLPKIALVENSADLIRRGLWRILSDLASIGYDAEWQTIRASDTGLPHKRARLFLIAYPESVRRRPHRRVYTSNLEKLFERHNYIPPVNRQTGLYLEANGNLYPEIPEHLRMDDGRTFELSEIKRAVKGYGNGVAVPVARWIGEQILRFDSEII